MINYARREEGLINYTLQECPYIQTQTTGPPGANGLDGLRSIRGSWALHEVASPQLDDPMCLPESSPGF
jgi:hypothetical protein